MCLLDFFRRRPTAAGYAARSIGPRVMATTTGALFECVVARSFPEDLYYRLNAICITVPVMSEVSDDIPLLVVVTWRGQDGRDAPEHLVMGRVMEPFLRLLDVPFEVFDPASIDAQLASLTATMRQTRRPVALVVPKGVLER